MRISRGWAWFTGIVAVLVVVAIVVSFAIDEPLRRSMERDVNHRLHGYTAHIGKLRFNPIGFSITLKDVTLTQNANPEPPVAFFPSLSASVQWRELLHLRVVANFEFDDPKLYVNRQHLEKEAKDPTPISQKGWQDALEAIYPFKINEFRVNNAEITYVDSTSPLPQVSSKPLTVKRLDLTARNIRNIESPDRVYPSTIDMSAVIFDTGKVSLKGDADFLAEPHAGVKADLKLEGVELARFEPVLKRYNMVVKNGRVDGTGTIEYAPQVETVHLKNVTVSDFDGDVILTPRPNAPEKRAARTTAAAASESTNRPGLLLKIDRFIVKHGTFGLDDRSAKQPYRVYLSDTDIEVSNLSNQHTEGTSTAKLTGKFMGSGATAVNATFRPELKGPDFSMNLKIEDTDMRRMNDLLRAHAGIDVVAGLFSVYSEMTVKNRHVDGYVKPLFSGLKVYDKQKDADKTAMQKLKEHAVDVAAKILKNRPRHEVATVATVSGPVGDTKTSTWQAIVKLLQNAFVKAILPGFVREAGAADRGAMASPRTGE